ncbi:MAG: hypothetical protein NVSMB34_07400 [Variovorax sp.]
MQSPALAIPGDWEICSGACGGDLIFAESSLALGADLQMHRPFDKSTFVTRSIDFAGGIGTHGSSRSVRIADCMSCLPNAALRQLFAVVTIAIEPMQRRMTAGSSMQQEFFAKSKRHRAIAMRYDTTAQLPGRHSSGACLAPCAAWIS